MWPAGIRALGGHRAYTLEGKRAGGRVAGSGFFVQRSRAALGDLREGGGAL